MNLFPNGGFVRLRSRARDKYVHADEDASGVSLRPLSAVPSLNAVWKADLWPAHGAHFLLLQGAAYGRYLAVAYEDEHAPPGHRGVRAVQRDNNSLDLDDPFLWLAVRVEAGQNYVRLRNYQRFLRANGRHRYWNNLVTVDVRNHSRTTMMQWMVEAIPSTPVPLPLPPPPQPPVVVIFDVTVGVLSDDVGLRDLSDLVSFPIGPQWYFHDISEKSIHVRRGLFKRRTQHEVHPHPGRRIRHMRLDDDGNFVRDHWPEFDFFDNSVSNLRTEVAHREDVENITLCVRAGMGALVTPLVTNLPNNVDHMEIIVYTTGSPAAAGLRYPQFDQPEA